jgi:hypothetical protein
MTLRHPGGMGWMGRTGGMERAQSSLRVLTVLPFLLIPPILP